jgi:hypothetical protein
MMKNLLRGLAGMAAVVLIGLTTAPAQATPSVCDAIAGNLVINCGFETGDTTSWVNTNFVASNFDTGQNSGNYSLQFGCVGQYCTTSQDIATTAGGTYAFSFFFASDGAQPNGMIVSFDGIQVLNAPNQGFFGWTEYDYTVTASSSLTAISFSGFNNPAYQGIDDVSVVSAPEPASMALIGVGLAGLGVIRRNRA